MSYKTLLVHVEHTPESEARLHLACRMAADLQARLIGVGGRLPVYLDNASAASVGLYANGAVVQNLNDLDKQALAMAERSFQRIAAEHAVATTWRVSADDPDQAVEGYACGADLILASAAHGPYATTIDAGKMALTCGLPVLALPAALTALRRASILIAWKNTREARRAVTDALPLLSAAREVVVVEVVDGHNPSGAAQGLDDVTDRLRRHGIEARQQVIETGSGQACAPILACAEQNEADLIVCGAYGHSRLREWSFGGMTRSLLTHSKIPILFSH